MKTKLKKMLTGLLAVMLIVASIPMSASAADADRVAINMSVVDLPEGVVITGQQTTFDTKIKNAAGVTTDATAASQLAGQATAINNTLTESTQGSGTEDDPYIVAKNANFYLAVDMDLTTAKKDADGVATQGLGSNSSFRIDFPGGSMQYMNLIKTNPICSSGLVEGLKNYDDDPYSGTIIPKETWDYYPGATAFNFTATATPNILTTAHGTGSIMIIAESGTGFLPKSAGWDFVMRMRALTAGKHKVEVEKYTNSSQIENVDTNKYSALGSLNYLSSRIAKASEDDGTLTNMGDAEGAVEVLQNTPNIESTPIWIKVESNEPTVSIPDSTVKAKTDDREITVSLKNGTFTDATAANYTITKVTGSGPATITPKADADVSKDKTTATLTFDASGTTVGDTYKVVVAKGAITEASGADDLSDNPETGTFKICANLADVTGASITNTANAAATGTLTYGDTLSVYKGANWPADAGTLTQKWTANGATMANNSASIDTSINAMAVAAGMDTDKPYVITCTVTSAALDNTSIELSTATGLAKKELNLPTTITGVPSVAQNAAGDDATVSGSYSFTTGLVGSDKVTVAYTSTYTDTSTTGNKTGLSITWGDIVTTGGASVNAGRYNIANKATVTTTGTGSVTKAGYTVSIEQTDGGTLAITTGLTGGEVSSAGGTISGTVTLDAGSTLNAVNITGDNGFTAAAATIDTTVTPCTFTYTFGSTSKPYNIKVKADISKGATPVTVTVSKPYDGTTAIDLSTVTLSNGLTLADFGVTGMAFTSAEVGSPTITTTPATIGNFTKDDVEYKFPENLTGTITKAAVGTITATGAQIDPKNATIDSVVAAVKAAEVMVEGVKGAQGTVGTYITNDGTIKSLIQTALGDGYTAPASANYTVNDADDTAALASTTITTLVEGDTYTFANGDTPTFKDDAGNAIDDPSTVGFTVTTVENGVTTVVVGAGAVTGGTKISATAGDITFGSAGTAIPPTAKVEAVAEKYDFSGLAGQNLALTLNLGTIASGALKDHFTDADNKTVAVTVPVKRTASAGNFGVTFDDKGYGKASEGFLEVDSTGKITALPTVTDVVLGAEFIGWSTNGDDKHIVDIDEYTVKEDITLTAVYRGYMAGYKDGTAKPERKVTRAELARMLVVASGKYDGSKDYGKPSYKDAQTGWYVPFVACAEDLGILHGYPDGTVKPNNPVTREEASLMIANAFGVTVKDGATTDKVNDFDKVGSWAQKYVATLCDNGTINGYPDGTFRATRSITRAEAAQMINIYLGLTKEDKDAIKADTTIKSSFPDVTANYWGYENIMFASLSVPATYYTTEITIPEAK